MLFKKRKNALTKSVISSQFETLKKDHEALDTENEKNLVIIETLKQKVTSLEKQLILKDADIEAQDEADDSTLHYFQSL